MNSYRYALLLGGAAVVVAVLLFVPELQRQVQAAVCYVGSAGTPQKCLMNLVYARLASDGPDAAMQDFSVLSGSYRRALAATPGACHILAHEVGERAYVLYPDPSVGLREPTFGMSTCNYGYYHAYLEELFEKRPDVALASSTCSVLAAGRPDAPAIQQVCFSSAGSGFVRALLPSGWGPDISDTGPYVGRPLQQCDELGQNSPETLRVCRGGVFGEIIYRVMTARSQRSYRSEQLRQICSPYAGDEQVACYQKMVSALFLVENYSLESLNLLTTFLPTAEAQQAAFEEGIGLFLIDPVYKMAPNELFQACFDTVSKSDWCLRGIMRGVFAASAVESPGLQVTNFCRTELVMSRGLDGSCYADAVVLFKTVYTPAHIQDLCGAFPQEFRYLCASK